MRRRRNRLPFAQPKILTRSGKKNFRFDLSEYDSNVKTIFCMACLVLLFLNPLGVVSCFLFLTLLFAGRSQPAQNTASSEVLLKWAKLDLPSVIS